MQAAAKALTILLAVLLTAGLPIGATACAADVLGCANESIAQSSSCCMAMDCCCSMSAPRPPAPQPDDSAVAPSSKTALGLAGTPSAITPDLRLGSVLALAHVASPALLHVAPLYSLTHSFLI
jgi:hypothetical protein